MIISDGAKGCSWYTFFMVVKDVLFQVRTPLGITIHTTGDYWKTISTIKHPVMVKYTKEVKNTLADPSEIRRSIQDPRVHLYYKNISTINVCVVADHLNSQEGYIITAYLTDRIKEGEQIYVKDKNVL